MAKENEVMLQAMPGATTVAAGEFIGHPDAQGLFVAPESVALVLLATPLLGIKRAPEKKGK